MSGCRMVHDPGHASCARPAHFWQAPRATGRRRIIVTGGSGKAGEAAVLDLPGHGDEVLSIGVRRPAVAHCRFRQVDRAQRGADAVVHLAASPGSTGWGGEHMVRHQAETTYGVFRAATLPLNRMVWASGEAALGLPCARVAPAHTCRRSRGAPAREQLRARECPRRDDGAALQPLGRRPVRRAAVLEHHAPGGVCPVSRLLGRSTATHVDVRDVTQGCRRGLEADIPGAHAFIIAAADTVMSRPGATSMADVYPDAPLLPPEHAYATLLGIGGARRHPGHAPRSSWRDHLEEH